MCRFLIVPLILLPFFLSAQSTQHVFSSVEVEKCGTDEVHTRAMEDPEYSRDYMKVLKFNQNSHKNIQRTAPDPIIVPVIVHVIHEGEDYGVGSHLTEEFVKETVTNLAENFAGVFSDLSDANTQIDFCIAGLSPSGDDIDGIRYYDWGDLGLGDIDNVYNTHLSMYSALSYASFNYCNIYVVPWSGNPLGFAYTPPAPYGVYVRTNAFGFTSSTNFGLNRTLVHEMGHYLGLYHIFNINASCDSVDEEVNCLQQGDYVCDTPPTLVNWSCNNPTCPELNPLLDNYMDYYADPCCTRFTSGQSDRMHGMLVYRPSLITDGSVCDVEDTCPYDFDGDGIVGVSDLNVFLSNYGTNGVGVDELMTFLEYYGMDCTTGSIIDMPKPQPIIEKSISEVIKTYIIGIDGRVISDVSRISPGLYIIKTEWSNGFITTKKIFYQNEK